MMSQSAVRRRLEICALHVRFESRISSESVLFHWSVLCLHLQSVIC